MVECEESRILFEILPPCSRQNDIVFEVDYPIPSVCEESHVTTTLDWDSSLHYVSFEMTVMSSRTYVRDLIQNTHPLGLGISCRGTEKEIGRGQKLL